MIKDWQTQKKWLEETFRKVATRWDGPERFISTIPGVVSGINGVDDEGPCEVVAKTGEESIAALYDSITNPAPGTYIKDTLQYR